MVRPKKRAATTAAPEVVAEPDLHPVLETANSVNHVAQAFVLERTADMWTAFMRQRLYGTEHEDIAFTGEDVAMFLAMHSMVYAAAEPGENAHKVDLARLAATAETCRTAE